MKEKTPSPTQAQSAVKSMEATQKKIESVEPRNLYQEEKQELALNTLKRAAETLLAAITEPPPEEIPARGYIREVEAP